MVAVVDEGHEACTGTLVGPRVVLTAAHCLLTSGRSSLQVYFGPGTTVGTGRLVDTLHSRAHPDFDAATLAHDVAVLLLAEPAGEPPIPLATGAPAIDDPIRFVGFGHTGPGGVGDHIKRSGTGLVAGVDDDTLEVAPDPAQPCEGDSGGPGLVADGAGGEVLAGVVSAGDPECAAFALLGRADRVAGFVSAYVEATAEGAAGVGERCWYPDNCATGECLFDPAAEGLGYCSGPCQQDGCPAGLSCRDQRCVRDQPVGTDDQPCAWDDDCISSHCARPGADAATVCASTCLPGGGLGCAEGFECLPDADDAGYLCFAAPGGGCRATSGRPGAGLLLLIACLLGAVRRRRRHSERTAAPSAP